MDRSRIVWMLVALAGFLVGGVMIGYWLSPRPTTEPVASTSQVTVTTTATATVTAPAPAPASSQPATETAQQVAARIGCTGFKASEAPFVSSFGSCTFRGAKTNVYVFANASDQASFGKVVAAYGVTPAMEAVHGLVMAAPDASRPDLVPVLRGLL